MLSWGRGRRRRCRGRSARCDEVREVRPDAIPGQEVSNDGIRPPGVAARSGPPGLRRVGHHDRVGGPRRVAGELEAPGRGPAGLHPHGAEHGVRDDPLRAGPRRHARAGSGVGSSPRRVVGSSPTASWRRRSRCCGSTEYTTGGDLGVDRWILEVPGESLGLAPIGRMALLTAVGFVLAGITLALADLGRRRQVAADLASLLALALASLGGRLRPRLPLRRPFLYGGRTIPMALNTAFGFVMLGVGLVAAAGPRSVLLRPLCGPSVRGPAAAPVPAVRRRRRRVDLVGDPLGRDRRRGTVAAMVTAVGDGRRPPGRRGPAARGSPGGSASGSSTPRRPCGGPTTSWRSASPSGPASSRWPSRSSRRGTPSCSSPPRTSNAPPRRSATAHQELQAAYHELQLAESQLVQSEKLSGARPDGRRRGPRDQQPAGLRQQQRRRPPARRRRRLATCSASTSRPRGPSTVHQRELHGPHPRAGRAGRPGLRPRQPRRHDDPLARRPEADPADRQGPPRLRPARRGRAQGGRPQRRDRVDRQDHPQPGQIARRDPGDSTSRRSPRSPATRPRSTRSS